jgi:MoaA/NifB/PqqE/SkfB family radical SAM enzyme/quercetin dioxygenase-like cupin family protein
MKKIVVYTVITNNYDKLRNPSYIDQDVDYVCLTEQRVWFSLINNTVWQIKPLPRYRCDDVRRQRRAKILPHRFFPEYEYSVYVDGNIHIIGDVTQVLKRHGDPKILSFKHPDRDCIYAEGDECIALGKDEPATISGQLNQYRSEGYPAHGGLIEGNVLIRRHNDAEVKKVMEDWWQEVTTKSRRDQLSFNYVIWKNNSRYRVMGDENARGNSNVFRLVGSDHTGYDNKVSVLLERYLLWRFHRRINISTNVPFQDRTMLKKAAEGIRNRTSTMWKGDGKQSMPRLTSRTDHLTIPLPPDKDAGWKPYYQYKGGTANCDSLSCHVSVLVPGRCPHPPHSHKEEEILLMLAGEADLLLPELATGNPTGQVRLKPGQFTYYPAYFRHTLKAAGSEPANYLMFRWYASGASRRPLLGFGQFDLMQSPGTEVPQGFQARLLFEGSTGYLSKLHAHVTTLAPGAGYEPHIDRHDVAIILLEGEVETLGRRLKPHSLVFYAAGEPHGMVNPGTKPARYAVFEFHGERASFLRTVTDPQRWKGKLKAAGRGVCDRAVSNFSSGFRYSKKGLQIAETPIRQGRTTTSYDPQEYVRPTSVSIDASTVCQLRCPSCPNAMGIIAKSIGAGFLSPGDFEKFIEDHPWVTNIELSNWGEVFLNPHLEKILHCAYQRNVAVRIDNGANLNRVPDSQLEALVKYKVRSMTCAIDGASQEVYSLNRINGDFNRVIAHVRKINTLKKKYRSFYPELLWQFVAFGHNEHEISTARDMARELGMHFYVKLSWGDLYGNTFSPIRDRELIKKETGLGVADRREYEEKFGKNYIAASCQQLWVRPWMNFDGRLLGCPVNHWGDFGNVFTDGLQACLSSEKMNRTKDVLMGLREAEEETPCLLCQVFKSRSRYKAWVRPEELTALTSKAGN